MAASSVSVCGVGSLLFLHLERCKVDRQGKVSDAVTFVSFLVFVRISSSHVHRGDNTAQ